MMGCLDFLVLNLNEKMNIFLNYIFVGVNLKKIFFKFSYSFFDALNLNLNNILIKYCLIE